MSEVQNTGANDNRGLVRGVTLAAGVLGASLLTRAARAQTKVFTFETDIPGTGDIKVLNFALALEDLESALYQQAITRLTALGANTGTTQALFNAVSEFSVVESDHALFLRNAITAAGGPAISHFTYNFTVAGGTPIAQATAQSVFELVLQAEATGVRAYLGAIPFFTSQSAYLPIAAAIQGTEARHATVLTQLANPVYGYRDVAPLATDAVGGSTLSYDTVVYNSAKPNEGSIGIDDHMQPNTVLKAISPFLVAAMV